MNYQIPVARLCVLAPNHWSSLWWLLSASSSLHLRTYLAGVPTVPYCGPSESFPVKTNCTVLKTQALNSGDWFDRFYRMPSQIEVQLFFSSITPTAMPLT